MMNMKTETYVIGNLNLDAVMGFFTDWPKRGTEVEGDFFDMRYAGAAGNAALALKSLGFNVHVVSALGNDALGKDFAKEFEKRGIDISRCKISKKMTGISFGVVFDDRERTFFSFLGALEDVTQELLVEKLNGVENSWIFLCGFNVIPALRSDGFLHLVKRMKENGNTIVFDPGWPSGGWVEELRKKALRLAALSDWFMPNKAEAMAISQKNSVDESLDYFSEKGVKNCVVKTGKSGSKAVISNLKLVAKAFNFTSQAIDTVGAGDLFNSAFVKGINMGWETDEALNFASFYASFGITQLGEKRYPTFEEILLKYKKDVSWRASKNKISGD